MIPWSVQLLEWITGVAQAVAAKTFQGTFSPSATQRAKAALDNASMSTKPSRRPRAMAGVALGGPQLCEDVRAVVEQGVFRVTIAQRFPLSEIAHAHRALEESRPHGSVVIEVAHA